MRCSLHVTQGEVMPLTQPLWVAYAVSKEYVYTKGVECKREEIVRV